MFNRILCNIIFGRTKRIIVGCWLGVWRRVALGQRKKFCCAVEGSFDLMCGNENSRKRIFATSALRPLHVQSVHTVATQAKQYFQWMRTCAFQARIRRPSHMRRLQQLKRCAVKTRGFTRLCHFHSILPRKRATRPVV